MKVQKQRAQSAIRIRSGSALSQYQTTDRSIAALVRPTSRADVVKDYQTGQIELTASTVKMFETPVIPRFLADRSVKQFNFKNWSFSEIIGQIQEIPNLCNLVETVFVSKQGKPIALASSDPLTHKILVTQLPSGDMTSFIKKFLKRAFHLQFFTNDTLIQLLSDPKTNSTNICFANYGTQETKIALLTPRDLCKPFLQTVDGVELDSLQFYAVPDKQFYKFTFEHYLKYDAQTNKPLQNDVQRVAIAEGSEESFTKTQETQINSQLKRQSDKILSKFSSSFQGKVIQVKLVYLIEAAPLQKGGQKKYVPWLLRVQDCTTSYPHRHMPTTKVFLVKSDYTSPDRHFDQTNDILKIPLPFKDMGATDKGKYLVADQQLENNTENEEKSLIQSSQRSNRILELDNNLVQQFDDSSPMIEIEDTVDLGEEKRQMKKMMEFFVGAEIIQTGQVSYQSVQGEEGHGNGLNLPADQIVTFNTQPTAKDTTSANLYASLAVIASEFNGIGVKKLVPSKNPQKQRPTSTQSKFQQQLMKRASSCRQNSFAKFTSITGARPDSQQSQLSTRGVHYLNYLRQVKVNKPPTERFSSIFDHKMSANNCSLDTLPIMQEERPLEQNINKIGNVHLNESSWYYAQYLLLKQDQMTWWKNPALHNAYLESQDLNRNIDPTVDLLNQTKPLKNVVVKEIDRTKKIVRRQHQFQRLALQKIPHPVSIGNRLHKQSRKVIDPRDNSFQESQKARSSLVTQPQIVDVRELKTTSYKSRPKSSLVEPTQLWIKTKHRVQVDNSQIPLPVVHDYDPKREVTPQTLINSDISSEHCPTELGSATFKLELQPPIVVPLVVQCDIKLFCQDEVNLMPQMIKADQCYVDRANASEASIRIKDLDNDKIIEAYHSSLQLTEVSEPVILNAENDDRNGPEMIDQAVIKKTSKEDFIALSTTMQDSSHLQPCCARCFCILTFVLSFNQ